MKIAPIIPAIVAIMNNTPTIVAVFLSESILLPAYRINVIIEIADAFLSSYE